jgi:hypothetical protein
VNRLGRIGASIAGALLLAACGSTPMASGSLVGCGDGRGDAVSIGGFPELEDKLPSSLEGRAPDLVNSGRSCSDKALGSLASHGVTELTYAGATWKYARSDATVIALLHVPGGQPDVPIEWIEEFYTAGAVAGTKTDNVTTTRPTMAPAGKVFRLDALNDLSLQTIVLWQDASQFIRVVIVATEVGPTSSRADHDARVAAAVAAVPAPGVDPDGAPTTAPASASAAP